MIIPYSMDSTDLTSQYTDAERSVDSDDLHYTDESSSEDDPIEKNHPLKKIEAFDDLGSTTTRSSSRSRPDSSLALHGRMSERMSAVLFEQIAIERSEIAFKEFYEFLAPKVYSVIYRIIHIEDDALDILQEVFTHFWNAAPELYKVHSNISAWILLLARNRAVDETRSSRFRSQRQTESYDDLEHESLIADTHAPDEKLTEDAARQEIRSAFQVLTEDQRKIMELVFFAGMTMKAVADSMQVSPGSVRKTVHDSVKKLRHVLKPDDTLHLTMDTQTMNRPTMNRPTMERPAKKKTKKASVIKEKRAVKPTDLPETSITPQEIVSEENRSVEKKPVLEAPILEPSGKKPTNAERKSRRAMKLHSILDDLMKNRLDVLDTPATPNRSANTTLDNQ